MMATKRKPAETVEDIFRSMGRDGAELFISMYVHELPPGVSATEATKILEGIHHGVHKDTENLAQYAVERYNRRFSP